jgi:SET domain-containing protein
MNYSNEPITMWFDRRLVLRKSPIHGIGTFITDEIAAGELLILVTGGIVYTPEDWQTGKVQLEAELYNEAHIAQDLCIATPKSFHYYVNHSCDANIVDLSRSGKATQYVATRTIRANEEITADYYDETSLAHCNCQSPMCRWVWKGA